jgi:hypothetical protein
MGNLGIKVSRKGYDVKTCADQELVFSSSWPTLKIFDQGSFTIADTTQDVTLKNHALGYYPLYLVFVDRIDPSEPATGPHVATTGTSQFIGVDSSNLKWWGATRGAGAGTISGRYYIYHYNMITDYTAPIISTADTLQGSELDDYGIKETVDGASTSSTDLREFSIHSGTRKLLIHRTGYGSLGVGGGVVTITHSLGYEPMFMMFAKIQGYTYYQMVFGADDSAVDSNTTAVKFAIPYQCDYAYIIFKDPIL